MVLVCRPSNCNVSFHLLLYAGMFKGSSLLLDTDVVLGISCISVWLLVQLIALGTNTCMRESAVISY